MINSQKHLVGKIKPRGNLENISVDGMVTLKCMLRKEGMKCGLHFGFRKVEAFLTKQQLDSLERFYCTEFLKSSLFSCR
jgi:hypothetical protein